MNNFQNILVILWGIYSFLAFAVSYKKRKNPFGLCYVFNPLGAFVWVDAVVFGLFFFLVTIFCLITQQWILFLLIFSVFWTIRSIGEQVYWFLEQFAVKHRNPPRSLWPAKFFKGEEVWIVMQIFWQCVSVIGLIASVWLFNLYLK